jgi:hypothetical protein
MSSPAQIAANQRNAELSTGPKTSEGKAVSSKNASKHGLLALDVILPDEDLEAFVEFIQGLEQEFNPQGELEHALVERIVALLWRLRRAGKLEAAVLFFHRCRVRKVNSDEEADESVAENKIINEYATNWAIRGASYINGENSLAKLSRYESSIQRNLLRMMHELQRLQAVRKGEPVAAPQALDIDVTGLPELPGTRGERD